MIAGLPDHIGQKDKNRKSYAVPQPFAFEVASSIREKNRQRDRNRKKSHGVFGLQAEANGRPNGQPPMRIPFLQQFHDEICGQHPAKIIKRNVLH